MAIKLKTNAGASVSSVLYYLVGNTGLEPIRPTSWPYVDTSEASTSETMVDLMMAYSKRYDLCEELGRVVHVLDSKQIEYGTTVSRSVTNGHAPRVWRLRDRLTAEDVERLIGLYRAGMSGQDLANAFGIGLSSVKALLRNRQARRKDPFE